MLGLLFGNNNNTLLTSLASLAGFKNSGTAGKIMSIAAPLVMAFLRKKSSQENFGVSGLTTWLSGHKKDIAAALPGGWSSSLGFANLTNDSHSTHKTTTTNYSSSDNNNGGGSNWWMWLVGLLGALGLLWFAMKGCNMGWIITNGFGCFLVRGSRMEKRGRTEPFGPALLCTLPSQQVISCFSGIHQ